MRRFLIGTTVAAVLFAGAALAPRQAAASKPFSKVTKLECSSCHTSKDEKVMSEKDLTPCGKASEKVLKDGGYTRPKEETEKLKAATKLLKGFKCP